MQTRKIDARVTCQTKFFKFFSIFLLLLVHFTNLLLHIALDLKKTYSTISFFSNHNGMISKYWEFIQRGSIMLKVISLDFFSRTLKNARIE